jgi:hypothetical protein
MTSMNVSCHQQLDRHTGSPNQGPVKKFGLDYKKLEYPPGHPPTPPFLDLLKWPRNLSHMLFMLYIYIYITYCIS